MLRLSSQIGRFITDQDFTFDAGRFVQVKLTFATAAFDELRAIFIERYGPPTDEQKATVKTQAGGTFTNDVVTWSGVRIVRIERYFTTIDTGFAISPIVYGRRRKRSGAQMNANAPQRRSEARSDMTPNGIFRTVAVVVFTCVAALAQTEWPQEPSDFRGVPFGTSQRDARRVLGFSVLDCSGVRCIDSRFMLGHVALRNELFFHDGKFVQAVLTFASSDFDYLRDVFVQRYGAPMKTEHLTVKRTAGAEHENERLEWRGSKAVIVIARYTASDALTGFALVTERKWSDELDRMAEQQKRDAARKF